MDLGATVCSRARPACTVCPMSSECVAALEGRQAELPGAKQQRARGTREATLLIAETGEGDGSVAVLVERRPLAGIWGGLWAPPQFESEFAALDWCRREIGEPDSRSQPLAPIHHAFTHFDLRLNPIRVRCRIAVVHDGDERLWYRLDHPPRVGLPQPIFKLFEQLRDADEQLRDADEQVRGRSAVRLRSASWRERFSVFC